MGAETGEGEGEGTAPDRAREAGVEATDFHGFIEDLELVNEALGGYAGLSWAAKGSKALGLVR